MKNKYDLLNKVVLYTIESYFKMSIEGGAKLIPLHVRLLGAINGYKKFHLFTPEQSREVISYSDNERLNKILKQDVSFIVFALELVKLWIEDVPKENRPHLNISDKRLVLGS